MRHFQYAKHIATSLLGLCIGLMQSLSTQAHEITVHKDILWASPNNIQLTTDIYVPKTGKKSYPVLVVYHGGGWLINNNSIMNSLSAYIASHSDIIVANMNYRLLVDNQNTTTLNEIIEDAMGGLLWVKDNISQYGGDPKKIAITGDSAGAHLSAMILMGGRTLESGGFSGKTLGFKPTYLPKHKTAEQIAKQDGLKVQAAVMSYGVFDVYAAAKNNRETASNIFWELAKATPRGLFGNTINLNDNPNYYYSVSPIHTIPNITAYKLPPQFVHVGSKDTTTPPSAVEDYVKRLRQSGQAVEYKEYPDRNHAFLDNDCNQYLQVCFDRDAPEVLNDMIKFLQKNLK